jgi:hypothetical protein
LKETEKKRNPCHDGSQQEEQTLPVSRHVRFRQFDAYGEYADGEDDSRELQRDRVRHSFGFGIWTAATPSARVEEVGSVWTDDDAEQEGPAGFSDVELCVA